MLIITDRNLGKYIDGNYKPPIEIKYRDGRERNGGLSVWCREGTSRRLYILRHQLANQTVDIFGIYGHRAYFTNQRELVPKYKPLPGDGYWPGPDERGQRFWWFMKYTISAILEQSSWRGMPRDLFSFQRPTYIEEQTCFPGNPNILKSNKYISRNDMGTLLNVPGNWFASIPVTSFVLLLPRVLYHIGQNQYATMPPVGRKQDVRFIATFDNGTEELCMVMELLRWLGWSTLAMPTIHPAAFWSFIYFLILAVNGKIHYDLFPTNYNCSGFASWLADYMDGPVRQFYNYFHQFGHYGFIGYPGG